MLSALLRLLPTTATIVMRRMAEQPARHTKKQRIVEVVVVAVGKKMCFSKSMKFASDVINSAPTDVGLFPAIRIFHGDEVGLFEEEIQNFRPLEHRRYV
jgi:hypothetical protein